MRVISQDGYTWGPAPQDISMVPEATVHGLDTTPDQKCLSVLGKAAKGNQCGITKMI